MFGKLENGRLVIAGQKIQVGNVWITNPTEQQLRANGYKEVEYTERPTYDKENEKLIETYTDGETLLVPNVWYQAIHQYLPQQIALLKV